MVKIRLENKVIDIAEFEIRPKSTEQDLENYYDSFISHAEEIGDYFEDKNAFDKSLEDSAHDKRPKLIPRTPKLPLFWFLNPRFMPFNFLTPSKRRLDDKYFITASCMMSIPQKIKKEISRESLQKDLEKDLIEKFKQYPGYEGIIQIPNDEPPSKTKSNLFHEAVHYLIARYHTETGRNLVDSLTTKRDISSLEEYQAEHLIGENVTGIFADKLLIHDSDAQFESRWTLYLLNNLMHSQPKLAIHSISAIATGLFIGYAMFNQPYLLPMALIPGRIRDYMSKKHKQSKRNEILKPMKYPKFKI